MCGLNAILCFFSGTFLTNQELYLYGVVGPKVGYYQSTTASAYHVYFTLDGLSLCNELLTLLDHPLFDNDMIIVRFPDQNASLDDPNLDRLFRKENGKCYSRHGYHRSY